MASIRIRDDGNAPVTGKGREAPFKQGEYYVLEVTDEVARYWNKMAPARRAELATQSRKEGRDVREILETFVHRPAHIK